MIEKKLESIVKLYQSRMADVQEFLERTRYLFDENFSIGEDAKEKAAALPEAQDIFAGLAYKLETVDPFNTGTVEESFREFVEKHAIKMSDLVHPVRLALTDSDVGPGLFETMDVLGKEKTVKRLKSAI